MPVSTLPTKSRPRRRLVVAILAVLLTCVVLFVGLLWLPVPLRIGEFELAAYVRAEQPGTSSPGQGITQLSATGFRGEKSREVIFRVGNHSLRIAWIIGS